MKSEEELRAYGSVGDTLQLATAFCRPTRQHGGVAIYSKDTIKFQVKHCINNLSLELHCELAAIQLNEYKLTVIVVYRSQLGNYETFLDVMNNLFSLVYKQRRKFVICGDFNIKFPVNGILPNINQTVQFLNLCNTYGIKITINEPTRYENCLDNVLLSADFTSNDYRCVCVNSHISDHLGQHLLVN